MEQTSYLYQIFMDYNHSLVLPTVQQLLEHSFYNNDIKLAEVSSACMRPSLLHVFLISTPLK